MLQVELWRVELQGWVSKGAGLFSCPGRNIWHLLCKYWIFVCVGMLLFMSLQDVVIYRINYMVLLLLFILCFQVRPALVNAICDDAVIVCLTWLVPLRQAAVPCEEDIRGCGTFQSSEVVRLPQLCSSCGRLGEVDSQGLTGVGLLSDWDSTKAKKFRCFSRSVNLEITMNILYWHSHQQTLCRSRVSQTFYICLLTRVHRK